MQSILNDTDRRVLLYFPILHTEADLGRMGGAVRRQALQRSGMAGVVRKTNFIDMIWTRIEAFFEASPLPFDKMYLYQDGLPVCEQEKAIVKDMAHAGSRNHKLLVELMTQGAKLMGTESAELLVKEYACTQKILASLSKSAPSDSQNPYGEENRDLLKQRDQFIAGRINQTLNTGTTGILFIGMLHDIMPGLEGDIDIVHPLNQELITKGR